MNRTRALFLAVLLGWVDTIAWSKPALTGPEILVNTRTNGSPSFADVASDPLGNFTIVWEADGVVFGQRYSRKGTPVGPNFKVSSRAGYKSGAAVSMDVAGNIVVVWAEISDGQSFDVVGRRFDWRGRPLGPDFVVNAPSFAVAVTPDVASDGFGNFVVVWESRTQAGIQGEALLHGGSICNVFGQRFDRTGNKLGAQFWLNANSDGCQADAPVVASDLDGNFVVAWTDYGTDRNGRIVAQRFDRGGRRRGRMLQVNSPKAIRQVFWLGGKAIASDALGGFVVVWNRSPAADGTSDGVFGQRFDERGARSGDEFQISRHATGAQWPVAVASDWDGNFLVSWAGGLDAASTGIYGQTFDEHGRRLGPELRISCEASGQASPAAAADFSGHFVVTWDSNDDTISAQRIRINKGLRWPPPHRYSGTEARMLARFEGPN